jgi:hypothetical protein
MLDPTARERLAVLADVLIPGSGEFPPASAAGVPTDLIDLALGFRPDLVAALDRALDVADGLDAEAALDLLCTVHSADFEALSTLVSGAYRPAPRQANDDVDSYVDLLEIVVDRGFDIHGADLS